MTTIILGSYDCDTSMNGESDYDEWCTYVCERARGNYNVEYTSWSACQADRFIGNEADEAREWLQVIWDEFCSSLEACYMG